MIAQAKRSQPIDIGSRLEPLIDDHMIDWMRDVRLVLNRPVPREVSIVHDQPWEGNTCFYHTVFRDGNFYRMYYRGAHSGSISGEFNHGVVCYAESGDGIHWNKPELGLVEFNGSKKNNIVWDGLGGHALSVFKDENPECETDSRYKAVAKLYKTRPDGTPYGRGIYPYKSADGIRWSLIKDSPVITEGAMDSQNLAFWDSVRGCYVDYHRGSREQIKDQPESAIRDVLTCTSDDFLNWTEPEWLEYPQAPTEHLYTNQIIPYFRAPHIYMGFPKRFVPTHTKVIQDTGGTSDALLMTSRDGKTFNRWGEALIRPGPQRERWVNRNNMVAWGIVETKSDLPGTPNEMSIYSVEGYKGFDGCKMRRYSQRLDGFVSIQAPLRGGELTTKSFVFEGTQLVINYATSAAGSIRVELQDSDGRTIEGLSIADSVELYGDDVEEIVSWKGDWNLSRFMGKPIRLRFMINDADLYSFRFRNVDAEVWENPF